MSRHRTGQLCGVERLLIRLIRQMSSFHPSPLAPLSTADGIASECWLNMPLLCPGNPTDTCLLKMGRIPSKMEEDLCQRTLKILLCIQRRTCIPVNLESSSKWQHTDSSTIGQSASPYRSKCSLVYRIVHLLCLTLVLPRHYL